MKTDQIQMDIADTNTDNFFLGSNSYTNRL
jgi:hypothetical protein